MAVETIARESEGRELERDLVRRGAETVSLASDALRCGKGGCMLQVSIQMQLLWQVMN